MKQESLVERYQLAESIGFDNGYGIGYENFLNYAKDDYEQYLSDCSEAESDYFRQYSPFEFTAQEFNRPVYYFDNDGNIVKEEVREWVNDKIWERYEKGVQDGINKAWKDAIVIDALGAPA